MLATRLFLLSAELGISAVSCSAVWSSRPVLHVMQKERKTRKKEKEKEKKEKEKNGGKRRDRQIIDF